MMEIQVSYKCKALTNVHKCNNLTLQTKIKKSFKRFFRFQKLQKARAIGKSRQQNCYKSHLWQKNMKYKRNIQTQNY